MNWGERELPGLCLLLPLLSISGRERVGDLAAPGNAQSQRWTRGGVGWGLLAREPHICPVSRSRLEMIQQEPKSFCGWQCGDRRRRVASGEGRKGGSERRVWTAVFTGAATVVCVCV